MVCYIVPAKGKVIGPWAERSKAEQWRNANARGATVKEVPVNEMKGGGSSPYTYQGATVVSPFTL